MQKEPQQYKMPASTVEWSMQRGPLESQASPANNVAIRRLGGRYFTLKGRKT